MSITILTYPHVNLMYRPGKELMLADSLSRTCPTGPDETSESGGDPMTEIWGLVIKPDAAPTKYQEATRADEELATVMKSKKGGRRKRNHVQVGH